MDHQFNIQQLYALPTMYLCVCRHTATLFTMCHVPTAHVTANLLAPNVVIRKCAHFYCRKCIALSVELQKQERGIGMYSACITANNAVPPPPTLPLLLLLLLLLRYHYY